MSTYRCTWCDAPLTYADGKTRVPHTSWCPRAPHDPPPARLQQLQAELDATYPVHHADEETDEETDR